MWIYRLISAQWLHISKLIYKLYNLLMLTAVFILIIYSYPSLI